jgi:hypothetical protein
MFTARDNLDEFRRDVSRAKALISDGLRHGVERACIEGADEARTTHRFANRSGELEGSIRASVQVSTPGAALGIIEALAHHASHVDGGTAPHTIEPRRAKALAFQAGGRTVFAGRVNHPGTKPDGFMGRAYHKAERVIVREVEVAVARAAAVLEG